MIQLENMDENYNSTHGIRLIIELLLFRWRLKF